MACVVSSYAAVCHTSLKTYSRSRLAEILEDRGQSAWFEPFVGNRSKLLLMTGALRTGLNMAVLLAILIYLERAYPGRANAPIRYAAAFVVAGTLISIFAVAVPISVVRYHRERILARSIPVLNRCLSLLWPVAVFLHLFDPLVRRLLGPSKQNGDSDLSDEILSVVEEHDDRGEVDEGQKEMLEAIVEFPSTTAGQIMTPRTDVQGIEIHATLDQVRQSVQQFGHSRIPVYDDNLDHLVGVLYAKDLIRFIGNDHPFELRKVLREAFMVPESKSLRELLAELKTRKVHIAIVLDEYGGTAGLVTIEDIIEEIVGEIHDEYERAEPEPMIHRISDTVVEADARVYIDDLNDELDLDLSESSDYDTLGGYVFSSLGHIPDVGESFDADGVRFTVTAAERTKVGRVRLDLLEQSAQTVDHDAVPPI